MRLRAARELWPVDSLGDRWYSLSVRVTEGRSIADVLRALAQAGLGPHGRSRVFGLRGSASAYLVARHLGAPSRPSVVIAAGAREAESWVGALRFFLGESENAPPLERRVHWFPSWDVEPLSGVSPTEEIVAERLSTLYHLNQAKSALVVTTAEALLQRLPPVAALLELSQYWVEGEEAGLERVARGLAAAGYQRVPQVEDRGEFAVRGGIVD
ncbi:MAG: hypothetical protein ABW298_12490, partial [Candidatus Binatia bacterium]